MSCNSLKQNFIFLLKDNNLSQKYQVVEEFVDNQFGFNADFFITITTEAESQVKHGQLDAGQKVQTSEQAKKQAEDQLRELINFEFDKISSSTSQLLRKQTGSCILKSENFYLVKECESCSARGKISCRACDANGHVRCRSCSGLGKSKCESCNGYGVFSCSSCTGTGKVAEYNRSIDDDIMDTLHKNYGGPVYRSCSACNGNGRKTCVSCGGSKTTVCNSCGGGGSTTCDTCNGSTQVTCNACTGHGCYSDITTKSAILHSYYKKITFSKTDVLAQSCLVRSSDTFLAGSTFRDVNKAKPDGSIDEKWDIDGYTQYEHLSIIDATQEQIKVGRLSSSNGTFSSTGYLDDVLVEVASNSLSNIYSVSQFKEKASEFPGIIRWAFGEKILSKEHAVIRPMYDALLSDGGKQAINSLRTEYLSKAQKRLYWPFYIVIAPICIGIMLFSVHTLQLNSFSTLGKAALGVGAIMIAHYLASALAKSYVSRTSKT